MLLREENHAYVPFLFALELHTHFNLLLFYYFFGLFLLLFIMTW